MALFRIFRLFSLLGKPRTLQSKMDGSRITLNQGKESPADSECLAGSAVCACAAFGAVFTVCVVVSVASREVKNTNNIIILLLKPSTLVIFCVCGRRAQKSERWEVQ